MRAAAVNVTNMFVLDVLSVVCKPWDVPVVRSWNRVLLNHLQRKRATVERGCVDRLNASRSYEPAQIRCYSKSPVMIIDTVVYSRTTRSFYLSFLGLSVDLPMIVAGVIFRCSFLFIFFTERL